MLACEVALQEMKYNISYGFDFEHLQVPHEIEKLALNYAK